MKASQRTFVSLTQQIRERYLARLATPTATRAGQIDRVAADLRPIALRRKERAAQSRDKN